MPTKTRRDLFNSLVPNGSDSDFQSWLSNHRYADGKDVYFDDEYLDAIAQYKDKPWYNQLLNNPWLAGNQKPFSPNFWQSLGEAFGDTSARDMYYAELTSNRSQWLSEFLERMRQEEYNDPTSQVARERAAGLNPDLNGSISAGSAAENDQPINPVEWPSDSVTQSVGSFGLQFVSQVIGMAQSFQALRAGSNQLVSQEIHNNESARDFVLNQLAGSSFFNSENDLDNISAGDLASNILSASSKVDWSIYSPHTRKLMKRMFNRYAKDVSSGRSPMAVESLKSELRNRIVSNNKSAVTGASSPLFDEDFNSWLRKVAEVFGKAEYKVQVAEYNSRLSKANYDSKYFHALSPELQASAENETAKATKATESQKAIIEGMWNDIYKICKDSDSWYGTIGLVLIPFLRSMASNLSVGAGRYGKGKFGITGINF